VIITSTPGRAQCMNFFWDKVENFQFCWKRVR
jgi:hypothetical protein